MKYLLSVKLDHLIFRSCAHVCFCQVWRMSIFEMVITGEKKHIELLKGNVFCFIHKRLNELDYFVVVHKQLRKIGYAAVLK